VRSVLEGLRVVEQGTFITGPCAGMFLADLGADVVKVEGPTGDPYRAYQGERFSPHFQAYNRNKRSVVLDLKRKDGQAALRTMALTSDVLLHSVRAASAARLGLSYESLAAENPRLVYCHVKGFSDVGAYAGRPAYDDIVQALSGLAMLQTIAAGEPRYVPSIVADKITAVHAAYAIMLALFSRERTGRGQSVGVPMLETMVAFNSAEHLGGCVFEPPEGKMGYEPVRQGMRRPFRTRDGWLCVLPYTDTNWRRFFELAGRPDLAADPRYGTQQGRQQNLELVLGELARQLATRASAEWIAALGEADIPFAAVNDLEDLLHDPHLESIGFWQLVEHPTEGRLRLPANPIELSATPPSIRRLPPRLGEHTAEVLASFGFDAAAIERLAAGKDR
jgi:crotonobetainyl-CoA:carnitine CoA-transferase CaiB-like acyl-CoA transferase